MNNSRKASDVSPPIRLPKQSAMPTARDIVQMASESQRSKKRVELPWQPPGRPEPVVLVIRPNELAGKPTWTIYSSQRENASAVWTSEESDPEKLVRALNDWMRGARAMEGWTGQEEPIGPVSAALAMDTVEVQTTSFPTMSLAQISQALASSANPGTVAPATSEFSSGSPAFTVDESLPAPVSTPLQPQFQPQPQTPYAPTDRIEHQAPGYPPYQAQYQQHQQQYPQHPGYPQVGPGAQQYPANYPVPPGYPAPQYPQNWGYPAGQQQYAPYPYQYPAAPPVPPHWTQYPQPVPPGYPAGPMSPEQWTAQGQVRPLPYTPPVGSSLLIGDVLVAAGLIPTQTLTAALSLQNASPGQLNRQRLGDILVNTGALPRHVLEAAIYLQELARRGAIQSSRITEVLLQVHATGASAQQVLGIAASPPPVPVADRAVSAQYSNAGSSTTDGRPAVAEGAIPGTPVPPVAVPPHAVPPLLPPQPLNSARQQTTASEPGRQQARHVPTNSDAIAKERVLPRGDARIEAEGQVSSSEREKFSHVMSLLKEARFDGEEGASRAYKLLAFFKQSGILKHEQVEAASKTACGNASDTVKSLLVTEAIDPIAFKAGIDCQKLMLDGRLKPEQGIIALLYCHRCRASLKDALADLSWDVHADDLT